jgi:sugar O-acyltransferase (sialic acid O-acetyltransferase NeuD family)
MRKRLIVISAGDFGREVAWLARRIPSDCRDWDFAGFLDDRKNILDQYPNCGEILGDVDSYEIIDNDRFVCAIGFPKPRLEYAKKIQDRGGIFANVMHPGAEIGDRNMLGSGLIVFNFSTITTDIIIQDHVVVMPGAVIGHNAEIGEASIIGASSFMGGYSKVGKCSFLAPHSVLLPHKKIGDFSTLGAGSVGLANVTDEKTVFGIPAVEIHTPGQKGKK